MADVFAVFGILLMLGIVFPGMLTAGWLLFPAPVERARRRLAQTPWRCFWVGAVTAGMASLPALVLLALPLGPAKLLGSLLLFAELAFASLGAAGIAAEIGQRLHHQSNGGLSPASAFVRGAIILELAAAFPVIGWFIVIPIAVITAFGAAVFALIRREAQPAIQVTADPALSGS